MGSSVQKLMLIKDEVEKCVFYESRIMIGMKKRRRRKKLAAFGHIT